MKNEVGFYQKWFKNREKVRYLVIFENICKTGSHDILKKSINKPTFHMSEVVARL